MRLTSYSDYSLRVLLYLALRPDEISTVQEIADGYDISKNHLMKVVNNLTQTGYVTSIRGRSGGLKLAYKPNEICLGEVVRQTEDDFRIVECFNPETNSCKISSDCKLQKILQEALVSFLTVLDQYTLQDLLSPSSVSTLKNTLGIDVIVKA